MPMTSPVDFISGPSNGIDAGKFIERKNRFFN